MDSLQSSIVLSAGHGIMVTRISSDKSAKYDVLFKYDAPFASIMVMMSFLPPFPHC